MRHTTAAAPAVAALVGLALVVLPATATAVVPRGGHYAQSKANVIVATFDVVGGEVRDFHHSDTCATYNVPVPVMKVRSSGKFSFSGTAIQNAIDQEFTVNVRGRTVSRTTIAGFMTYEKTLGNGPACTTTTKFRVKRTGRARA